MVEKATAIPTGFVILNTWDHLTRSISVAGKIIRFDFSRAFGPMPVDRAGREITLKPRDPFWRAVTLWKLQGERMNGDEAIWHEPKQPVLEHLGGRHYRVIEEGEIGHDI